MDQAIDRKEFVDRQIAELVREWSLGPVVEALQALRGVALKRGDKTSRKGLDLTRSDQSDGARHRKIKIVQGALDSFDDST